MRISISSKAVPILESLQAPGAEYAPNLQPLDATERGVSEDLLRILTDELSDGEKLPDNELREVHRAHIEYFQSIQKSLPTRLEDPAAYGKLALLVSEVAKAAADLGYELPETVALGTVASRRINAQVIPIDAPHDDYLLVFNREILPFTDLFSRFIAARMVDEVSRYSANQPLKHRAPYETEMRLLSDVVYYVINRVSFFRDDEGGVELIISFDQGRPAPLAPLINLAAKTFKEMLNVSMSFFAVAHELAHLNLLSNQAKAPREPPAKAAVFHEEVMCDVIGCRVAAQAAARVFKDRYPHGWQKLGTVGSLFFLSCLSIVERCSYAMERGPGMPKVLNEVDPTSLEANTVGSYPTAVFRRHVVRAVLEEELRCAGAPEARGWIFESHDWIATLFDGCWPELQQEFVGHFEVRELLRKHAEEFRPLAF